MQDFVNTRELEPDREELADPGALAAWLRSRELLGPSERLGPADLERALELREQLRALLEERAHGGAQAATVAALNALGAGALLVASLDADGAVSLAPASGGLDGAFAALLAIVVRAALDGTWGRLKVCADDGCRWAFYDRSRNRSGQLVLDGGVRQPREGAQLPRPPPRGPRRRRRARLARTAPDRDVGALDQPRHERPRLADHVGAGQRLASVLRRAHDQRGDRDRHVDSRNRLDPARESRALDALRSLVGGELRLRLGLRLGVDRRVGLRKIAGADRLPVGAERGERAGRVGMGVGDERLAVLVVGAVAGIDVAARREVLAVLREVPLDSVVGGASLDRSPA